MMTATVKGGTVKIIQIRLSLVTSMPHRFGMSYGAIGRAIGRDRYARMRAALAASGFPFPEGFIGAVLLGDDQWGPDDPTHDLAVAIGLLTLQGIVSPDSLSDIIAIGELSLDGQVRHCRGVLPITAEAASRALRPILLVPASAIEEAIIVDRTHAVGIAHLSEIQAILDGTPFRPSTVSEADLADIKGLSFATRALEIAATGGHHLLLVGHPGVGRTMLTRRLPGLLPLLSREEAIEVTAIHSLAGTLLPGTGYVTARPFRAPHHTASLLAMVGGGPKGRPGEISLAHRGVLFLDEATEFAPHILQAVHIALSKAGPSFQPVGLLSATVICVASVHPCPCGYRESETRNCLCSENAVQQHWQRLRPLVGHFDLKVDLSGVRWSEQLTPNEPSAIVRVRVTATRQRQVRRQPWLTGSLRTNGLLNLPQLRTVCSADAIELAGDDTPTSLPILRVARSIADLADEEIVEVIHVQEAKRYQPSWPS
jgi:magnesium chelatase family protein